MHIFFIITNAEISSTNVKSCCSLSKTFFCHTEIPEWRTFCECHFRPPCHPSAFPDFAGCVRISDRYRSCGMPNDTGISSNILHPKCWWNLYPDGCKDITIFRVFVTSTAQQKQLRRFIYNTALADFYASVVFCFNIVISISFIMQQSSQVPIHSILPPW